MKQKRSDNLPEGFIAWMDELNKEAVQRDYLGWPLEAEIAHNRNCWITDFENGLTPAQALDANESASEAWHTDLSIP